MKTYLFLIIALLCISASCKKNNAPATNAVLPPATQEGKNTVGFTINGEVWVPYYKCGLGKDPCGEYSATYSTPLAAPNAIGFQFTRERDGKSSTLTFSSSGIGTITIPGNKIDSIAIDFQDENWSGNTGIYRGPFVAANNKLLITKVDLQNHIISGEFEFVLLEQNGSGKTITLKDGRFDFKFNACKCSN